MIPVFMMLVGGMREEVDCAVSYNELLRRAKVKQWSISTQMDVTGA